MERRRNWETRRYHQDGGRIIWYDKGVARGVATSDDMTWLYC